jgi:hypothetical protein
VLAVPLKYAIWSLRVTPAMEAGIADHVLELKELLS